MLTISELIELYNSGKSYEEIAVLAGCSKRLVGKKLAGHIIPRPARAKQRPRPIPIPWTTTDERDQLVVALYQGGQGANTIAQQLVIGKKKVYNILRSQGISIDSARTTSKLTTTQIQAANRGYLAGDSIPELAKDLGVSESSLRHHITNKRDAGDSLSVIPTELQSEVMRLAKDELWSSYRIAKHFGWNPQNVQRFLRRKGLSVGSLTPAWRDSVQRGLSGPQSGLEESTAILLDELGVSYQPQAEVGPTRFDFSINDSNIFIDVQGSYWHTKPQRRQRDRFKAGLVRAQHKRLVVIWDHELAKPELVKARICNAIGGIDFKFQQSVVTTCTWPVAKGLLNKWHYQGAGRAGYCVAALVTDQPAAVCVFAKATRQEIAEKQNLRYDQVLELTRLVVDPHFQARNFCTWLVARAIRLVRAEFPAVKRLVAFADTTYGHFGDIYKAGNWQADGECAPSYWYYHRRLNRIWHKKSIWNAAKAANMNESEYAKSKQLIKVTGQPKKRFIYNL